MIKELDNIEVITLFVRDVAISKLFYQRIFSANIICQDAVSAVLKFNGLLLNLLNMTESHELITPMTVGASEQGARFMFTVKVDDLNAVCRELVQHEIALLNGPIDRPWGRRTAAFSDPDGFAWEIAQPLP